MKARSNSVSKDKSSDKPLKLADDLFKSFVSEHAQGYIAIHQTSDPGRFYDKLDDLQILGNLREDGGSEIVQTKGYSDHQDLHNRGKYQLYTIVSASLLPSSKYSIGQELFSKKLFLGLDLRECIVKNMHFGDAESTYTAKNKQGRYSYKMSFSFLDKDMSYLKSEDRLSHVIKLNEKTAFACTQPNVPEDEDDLFFEESPPSNFRFKSEILLKVNVKSLRCLGAIAADVLTGPEKLLELIIFQNKLREHLGIIYPVCIYNSAKNDITLDFVDTFPQKISPNQTYELNIPSMLSQMSKSFPNGITVNETSLLNEVGNPILIKNFIDFMQYPCDEKGEPIFKNKDEIQLDELKRRENFFDKVKETTLVLKKLVPTFDDSDKIHQIHKYNRTDVLSQE